MSVGWTQRKAACGKAAPRPGGDDKALRWDTQALLAAMWDQWQSVFRNTLGQAERSLVSELREVRNKWAHQEGFSTDDAYRALDSTQRLLAAVSAEEATEVERQKQELLRVRFEEQARRETRKVAVAPIEGQPTGGLKPWREVVTPHPDVASGRYQQAEFAADLGQVYCNEGADEYRDPSEFFRRTFLTDGLQHLLSGALQRLSGTGGDPVVELQTNFGGGKTHSRDIFKTAAPCLVLIDEWVAYVRQLYGKDGLPGGSFETNLTFAQALTEAAKAVPNILVVASLMAAVIHALWERQDASLLILPASVPIDEPAVQFELTRYMEDPWVPVIEKDVDGPHSLPLQIDRENPNLGRYSACRRVARTLYLGSAPTLHTANRGLEDRQVKLGCAQPGESVAIFGDALRRLTDQATHLYVDGRRSWYSTQPSVTRLAQDRAAQQDPDTVLEEIKRHLRQEQRNRGDFARVYPCPGSSADVPDEREARLVILSPEHPHTTKVEDSPARKAAAMILDQRGSGPRRYRNMLVFLAADRTRLGELEQAVRQYLAWKSIEAARETLNLDAFQANQANTKREQAEETIRQRIPETYQWLLVPGQPDPQAAVEWQEIRLQGQDSLGAGPVTHRF